jgi:hypothetical protein
MSGIGEPEDEDYVAPQGGGLSPQQTPVIQGGGADDEFDIIETDEAGKVIGGQAPQDNRLTEDEGGQRPLIQADQDQGGRGQRRPDEPRGSRRQRQRDAKEAAARETEELRIRNRQLEDRLANVEGLVSQVHPRVLELGEANIRQQVANIDQQLNDANASYAAATRRWTEAMQAADTEAAVKAIEERDTALVRKTQLANTKQAIEIQLRRASEGGDGRPQAGDRAMPADDRRGIETRRMPAEPQAPRLSSVAQANVDRFVADNPWLRPGGTDVDSVIVAALDADVYRRGYRPEDPAYWDELERMMEEKLPHRFRQDDRLNDDPPRQDRQRQPAQQQPQARRAPPVAQPADRGAPAAQGRRQVRIDPQRKEAMILSGSIDSAGRVIDQKKYMSQLKSYEKFDRENSR